MHFYALLLFMCLLSDTALPTVVVVPLCTLFPLFFLSCWKVKPKEKATSTTTREQRKEIKLWQKREQLRDRPSWLKTATTF